MPDKAEFTNGYALLIGVGCYKDDAIRSVPATAQDAEDIFSTLIDPNVCAYPEDQVRLWTNEKATKTNIIDTLNCMKDRVPEKENTTVIIFFSGHGYLEDGEYYFLPHEAEMTICKGKLALKVDTALANKDFLGIVRQIPARRLVILLNTCYAGGAGTALSPEFDTSSKFVPIPQEALEKLMIGSGGVIISSSQAKQKSFIEQNATNSIFGKHLLAGLKGQGIVIVKSQIRIFELFNYLSEKVPEDADKIGEKQNPVLKAYDLVNDFPIALFLDGKAQLPPPGPPPGKGSIARLIEIQRTLGQACITHLAKKGPTYQDECDTVADLLSDLAGNLQELHKAPNVYSEALTLPLNYILHQVTNLQSSLREDTNQNFYDTCPPSENYHAGEGYNKARNAIRSKIELVITRDLDSLLKKIQ